MYENYNKKIGLLNFYIKIKYQFDQLYYNFKKSPLLNRVYDKDFIYEQMEFTYKLLLDLQSKISLSMYDVNLDYCGDLINFANSENDRKIKKYTYDIEKMLKEERLILKDCFIIFMKNKDRVSIKQFDNIGSVLNELVKG